MKLFNTPEIAKGYIDNRPYFHPIVIERIKSFLKLSKEVNLALDVGCGAGLSTIALRGIAHKVIGVDASESMINMAIRKEGVEYYHYPAEYLPFKERFDLITLAGSINWIDRAKFFIEARKILGTRSFIVVYDNDILGIMEGNDRFEKWYNNVYLEKYPRPPRNESPITREEAAEYGFEFEKAENYTNVVQYNLKDFIDYLFTQSNITSTLGKRIEKAESIKQWLKESLEPFFQSHQKTLKFGGYIWYLQRL